MRFSAHLLGALALTANVALAQAVDDRFDPSRSALEQLLEYAERVGVNQGDITKAIFDGRFNPHFDDLAAAFLELPGPSCEVMAKNWAQILPKEQQADEERWFIDRCAYYTIGAKDFTRHIEWNKRFGRLEPEYLFRLAKRTYFGNDSPSWAAPESRYTDFFDDPKAMAAMEEHESDSAVLYFQWISENSDPHKRDVGNLLGHYRVYRCFFARDVLKQETAFAGRECSDALANHPTVTEEVLKARDEHLREELKDG